MSTTYTSIWRLAVLAPLDPATANSWGSIQDSTMPLMEQGAVGITTVNIGGQTTFTLTTANNATDQARFLVQQYTGALTGDCTITVPNLAKIGYAQNATTGGHNVILSAGGTTATIPPNGLWYLFSGDGATNVSLVPLAFSTATITTATIATATIATATIVTLNVSGVATFSNTLFNGATTRLGSLNNLIGTQASLSVENPSGTAAQIMSSINAPGATGLVVRNDRTDGTAINFLFGAATSVGSITQNGSTTSYNQTSDQQLKVKIGRIEYMDAADVIEHIAALWFTWKAHPGEEPEPGFFAQQVHKVCPWAVTKGRGRPGSKHFRPWQMDASKLMPFVIAYIQGLGKRVAVLEGR